MVSSATSQPWKGRSSRPPPESGRRSSGAGGRTGPGVTRSRRPVVRARQVPTPPRRHLGMVRRGAVATAQFSRPRTASTTAAPAALAERGRRPGCGILPSDRRRRFDDREAETSPPRTMPSRGPKTSEGPMRRSATRPQPRVPPRPVGRPARSPSVEDDGAVEDRVPAESCRPVLRSRPDPVEKLGRRWLTRRTNRGPTGRRLLEIVDVEAPP